jgi:polysaccharide export outer membrane protein
MQYARFMGLVFSGALLGGCANSGFLPEGGPSQVAANNTATVNVGATADQAVLPFVLIAPGIDQVTALPGEPDRFGALPTRGRPEVRARVGDLVQVTIFESASGGLFTAPQAANNSGGGGNFVNLPPQPVDVNGMISVPYAGSIRIAGRTLTSVQAEIEGRLRTRAIEPQVIVTVQEERASLVTVLGTVKAGGRFPIRNTETRVLDAIARAGGIEAASQRGFEVVLQRGGHTARASMRRLVLDPASNVTVIPGDTIFVQPISRTVNVFGATGENSRVDIDVDKMSLTDALGRSKGFLDTRADVASVFVLRMESRHAIPVEPSRLAKFDGKYVPTVYQIRYDTPGGIFIGNHFRVRHGDVIYVSNASAVQVRKLLELIGLITRPTREIIGGQLITP